MVQETRLYDSDKDETRSMRSKEEANDYRYFPDPDLLPVEIDEAFIDAVRAHAAGAAGREGGAICARFRSVGLRCRRACAPAANSAPISKRWWRTSAVGPREARRQLGHGRIVERAQSRQSRDRQLRGWRPTELTGLLARIVDQHDLRQDRQGSVRGDVVRGQAGRCDHRGEGPASKSPTRRHRRR